MCVCECVCVSVYMCVYIYIYIWKDSFRKNYYRPTIKILKESYNHLRKSTLNGHKEKPSSIITSKSCHFALCRHFVKMKIYFDLSN